MEVQCREELTPEIAPVDSASHSKIQGLVRSQPAFSDSAGLCLLFPKGWPYACCLFWFCPVDLTRFNRLLAANAAFHCDRETQLSYL
jgi:hypothetical protein